MKKLLCTLLIAFGILSANAQTDKPIDSLLTNGRCLPSPFPSPPFPFSDWCGGPVIGEPSGVPDYLTQPLRKLRRKLTPNGQDWVSKYMDGPMWV